MMYGGLIEGNLRVYSGFISGLLRVYVGLVSALFRVYGFEEFLLGLNSICSEPLNSEP